MDENDEAVPPQGQETDAQGPSQSDEPTDPMAALERERDELRTLAQRTQADFVNFKRRVDDERGALARNASNHVLIKLLTVVDDLQRAVEALPEEAPGSWGDGLKIVLQNMHSLIQSEGVTAFAPAPGDTFDPAEHEAVHFQPSGDQPPGAVLSTFSPGYRTQDRVLRPAQVVVAKEQDGAVRP